TTLAPARSRSVTRPRTPVSSPFLTHIGATPAVVVSSTVSGTSLKSHFVMRSLLPFCAASRRPTRGGPINLWQAVCQTEVVRLPMLGHHAGRTTPADVSLLHASARFLPSPSFAQRLWQVKANAGHESPAGRERSWRD